jgi:hypothetical protein
MRTTALLALIACLSTACAARSPIASSSPAPADWSRVAALQVGTRAAIEMTGGRVVRGSVEAVSPSHLTLVDDGQRHTIAAADVHRVAVATRTRAGTVAKRGALVGGILGGLVSLFAESNQGRWSLALIAGWAGVGAAIGALDGSSQPDWLTVYDARPARGAPANTRVEPPATSVVVGFAHPAAAAHARGR